MATQTQTTFGRFEVRQWWRERDPIGEWTDDIVSASIGGDVPDAVRAWAEAQDDGFADPDGFGVYERLADGRQMAVCDVATIDIGLRVAIALDATNGMDAPRREEIVDYLVALRDAAGAEDTLGPEFVANLLLDPALGPGRVEVSARNALIDNVGDALTLLGYPNGGE